MLDRYCPGIGHSLLIPAPGIHITLSIFGELINFSLEVMAINFFGTKEDKQVEEEERKSQEGILEILKVVDTILSAISRGCGSGAVL